MKQANTSRQKIQKMTELAMLVALVVVLQILSAMIPPVGGVSITLTLVPVVVGAILFGIQGGAVLGFSFGLIVLINCVTGLDVGGGVLWNANPVLTALICLLKGTAAGLVPAILYGLIIQKKEGKEISEKRRLIGALAASAVAPVVNTGLFVLGALLFFTDTLYAWQAASSASNMGTYIIVGLAGFNFLFELIINLILTPAIGRIASVVGKKKNQ